MRRAALALLFASLSVTPGLAQARHPIYLQYDGFVRNPDASLTLAFGYHNLNRVDVSIEPGDDNRFLSGAADRNQPQVFLAGRRRFACVMVVPADFDGRLQWQVNFAGHGSTTTAKMLDPRYALEETSAKQVIESVDLATAPVGVCLPQER